MRLFIAVKIPDHVKEKIKEVYSSLPKDGVRPVSLSNLHYTLQFLGEVPDNKLTDIINKLKTVEFEPFSITVKGVGFFPNESYVRVVWLGSDDQGKEQLNKLANNIEKVLKPLGFIPDHPFKPHLTIARVKKKIDVKPLVTKFKELSFGRFEVSTFYLIKSTLTPNGPIYEDIGEFNAKA